MSVEKVIQDTNQNKNKKSSNNTEVSEKNPFYLPPPTTVRGWNTKRLLPNVLLSQYSAYAILFLIQDEGSGFLSSDIIDESNAIILGTPSDTVFQKTIDYYNNKSNFGALKDNSSISSDTLYYADSITNSTHQLFSLGGFNAVIKGYLGAKDAIHKVIPLTTKLSQLVQPDGKNICEISSCNIRMADVNGYCVVSLSLDCHDHQQLFSKKSLVNKLFQNFTKYLLVTGWQGASVEDIQMQIQSAGGTSIQKSPYVLDVTLNDGTRYELALPKPIIKTDGTLNLPLNDSKDAYVFDIDDTDYGNKMVIPLFSSIPEVDFQGSKVVFTFRASNASQGMKHNQALSMLFGGNASDAIKKELINKLNKFIKPIATYDIEQFFKNGGIYDAELQQATAESFMNEIASKDNVFGGGIFSAKTNIVLKANEPKNPITDVVKDSKTKADALKQEAKKKAEELKKKKDEEKKKLEALLPTNEPSKLKDLASYNPDIKSRATLLLNGDELKLFALKRRDSGVNINGLSNDSKIILKQIDSYLSKFGISGYISSGKRSQSTGGHHPRGNAIDIVTSGGTSMRQVAELLKSAGIVNSQRIQYEPKGKENRDSTGKLISTSSNNHIHITLLRSQDFTNEDKLEYEGEDTTIQDESPDIVDNNGNVNANTQGTIESIDSKNQSSNTITIDPETGEIISNGNSSITQNTNSSTLGFPNTSNTEFKQSKSLREIPAAYRLGDVITTILDVVDDLLLETNDIGSIRGSLSKAKIKQIEINNQTIDVDKLEEKDVFETINGKVNVGKKSPQFLRALDNIMSKQTTQSTEYNYIALSSLLDEIKSGADYMAETVGYDIVSSSKDDEQTNRFLQTLEYFRNNSCGTKFSEVKKKIVDTKYPALYDDYRYKVFKWNMPDYYEKFSTDFPITVADLPISVDTFTRCLQSIVYKRTCEDIVNEILTAVSQDYGFTLRLMHRTLGSSNNLANDFENKRSTYKTSGRKTEKIMIVIDDEFLTDERIIKHIQEANEGFNSTATSKGNLPNQFSVLTQGLQGSTESIIGTANTKDSLIFQDNFLNNEYSSKKLNDTFIIDYGSINSLVKAIKFSKVDGQYNIPNQYIYKGVMSAMQNVNGALISAELMNSGQRDLARNLASMQNEVGNYIVNTLKIMPAQADYEYKFIQILSEVMQSLDSDDNSSKGNNSDFFNQANVKTKLSEIKNNVNDVNVFEKDEQRRKFLDSYISTYLYNRPMGVKYNFYLGKINCTIHGTMGLGLMQGVYVRGIVPQLEGTYRITSISHDLNVGGGTFSTNFEATLVASNILNKTQKILSSLIK